MNPCSLTGEFNSFTFIMITHMLGLILCVLINMLVYWFLFKSLGFLVSPHPHSFPLYFMRISIIKLIKTLTSIFYQESNISPMFPSLNQTRSLENLFSLFTRVCRNSLKFHFQIINFFFKHTYFLFQKSSPNNCSYSTTTFKQLFRLD